MGRSSTANNKSEDGSLKRKQPSRTNKIADTKKKQKIKPSETSKEADTTKKPNIKVLPKKTDKSKEFWIKKYTTSREVIVIFSEEVLGPFPTKEEAVEALVKEVEEIEETHGLTVPEEDFVEDRRQNPPNNGILLVIKNCREKYFFELSTKKPKTLDGSF